MVTVMVVEDDALIRFSLVLDLETRGYTILDAANADEALGLLRANPEVRLVITDIDMPGSMDGEGLARHIDFMIPDLPVILISGKMAPPLDLSMSRRHFPLEAFCCR